MEALINNATVCIVGKPGCIFCQKAQQLFRQLYQIVPETICLETMSRSADFHDVLKQATGQHTVPYVFLHGEFIGGYDAALSLHDLGKLGSILHKECRILCDCGEPFCTLHCTSFKR